MNSFKYKNAGVGASLQSAANITLRQILDPSNVDLRSKKTHIVCTLGPACKSVDTLVKMIDAGMDICRFNFSHGSHEDHKEMFNNVLKAQEQRPDCILGMLLDTKGPEIRTGLLKNKEAHLKEGSKLKLVIDYDHVGDETCIACSYKKLPQSVKKGNIILIADGSVSCRVLETHDDHVITEVLNTAIIGEKKNMNLPNVKVDLPIISEKDKNDILNFAIPMGCNFIAASFIQSAEDVRLIRNLLGPRGRHIKIIPKIENIEGIINFDKILAEADGIMIARGDLGMEISPEKVFLAQKLMISKCNLQGKPIITATQMLESMTKNPRPTRAEVTDVANAVLDGTDCVMLSGETAGGKFPVEAVTIMSKICLEAEACVDYKLLYQSLVNAIHTPISVQEAVARSAVETAESIEASVIITLTETGYTARLIAKYKPSCTILALSASDSTVRCLNVHRGVTCMKVGSFQGTDNVLRNAIEIAKERNLVKQGDSAICIHGIKEEVAGSTNLMKVVQIE
ncbi:pyruvate kinase, putative [Plasmodium ovale]|uniref:Pyruvate kinase n=3 Tax=Plasmodium ovale TaxID=36330 RepID=A0A1A8W0N0_PLAOA|nr:pyruvate kinase, putative [Plasmodium ovale curtisi]SBS94102.1 pyruvate kinase, putative [Plasmodium ovale curtisi]SCP05003.1 pyruvate kinase, putative [Plasmodium ovale]